jgi:hypothetical protein
MVELTDFAAYQDKSGRINRLPSRLSRKNKLSLTLLEIFEHGVEYSEPELNQMLKAYIDDFALVRRTLVDMGYLQRDPYGKVYKRVIKSQEPSSPNPHA